MKDRFHIAVTGASGYIGRHTVMEAVNRGHHVTAIARNLGHVDPAWRENPQISGVELNLSARGAYARLTSALKGVDAVIHTAAAMSGDDREHEENTLRPTRALLKAMISRPGGAPRLVLVSSLTVYDTDVLTEGAMIDETKPIVVDTKSRDAYCRSKLVQEAMALEVAAMHDLELRIMRVGAVLVLAVSGMGISGRPLVRLLYNLRSTVRFPSAMSHIVRKHSFLQQGILSNLRTGPVSLGLGMSKSSMCLMTICLTGNVI